MKNKALVFSTAIALTLCPAVPPPACCADGGFAEGRSPAKYHDFLLKDGRSFRGRIVAYDQHTDIVSIECANKRLIKTSSAVFNKADQLHIKDWHATQCFRSESRFRISTGRKAVKGEKWSTPSIDIGWGGSSGSSGYVRNSHYDILLENHSAIPLRNMTVEYRIYFSYGRRGGVKCGNFLVKKLAPKSKKEVRTERYIPGNLNSSMFSRGTKTEVDGIWIRITLPLSNGRKTVREYCSPDNLSKHNEWTDSDIN